MPLPPQTNQDPNLALATIMNLVYDEVANVLKTSATFSGSITIGSVTVEDGSNPAIKQTVNADGSINTVVQGTAAQPLGHLASGTDSYVTVLATTARRSHILISLQGSNDAIISLDGGSNGHIYVPANSVITLDAVDILTLTNIQAKNAVGGSNFTNLNITVW